MSALVGGFVMRIGSFRNKMHRFNKVGSLVNTSMLLLSCLVFVLVTVFNSVEGIPDPKAGGAASESLQTKRKVQVYMLEISRVCAIFVIASYFMYIAVGSSVQIALFVVPFAVLVGWFIGDAKDAQGMNVNMDLDFGKLNVAVLVLSVLVVLSVIVDAKTNWLEGYMLVTAYAIIAVLYWFLPDDKHHP